jgi:hypothetical protein
MVPMTFQKMEQRPEANKTTNAETATVKSQRHVWLGRPVVGGENPTGRSC